MWPRPRRGRARPAGPESARAFTLLEVMNFIALACVLAALGMYGLARYVRHAKTAEAVGSVKSLAEAAAGFYDGSDFNQPAGTKSESARAMRHFPSTSRTSVPGDLLDVKGKRYQSAMGDWSVSPWSDLHFSIPQPQYYAYSFESQGRGVEARASATAHGDLDADGVISTYRLTVAPDTNLHANVAPSIERTNGEE